MQCKNTEYTVVKCSLKNNVMKYSVSQNVNKNENGTKQNEKKTTIRCEKTCGFTDKVLNSFA